MTSSTCSGSPSKQELPLVSQEQAGRRHSWLVMDSWQLCIGKLRSGRRRAAAEPLPNGDKTTRSFSFWSFTCACVSSRAISRPAASRTGSGAVPTALDRPATTADVCITFKPPSNHKKTEKTRGTGPGTQESSPPHCAR